MSFSTHENDISILNVNGISYRKAHVPILDSLPTSNATTSNNTDTNDQKQKKFVGLKHLNNNSTNTTNTNNNNNNINDTNRNNNQPDTLLKSVHLSLPSKLTAFPAIPGLFLQTEVLDVQTEVALIQFLDTISWSEALSRRTIHRGMEFNYTTAQLEPAPPMEPLLQQIATALGRSDIMGKPAEQLIINEYTMKQGIGAHIDSTGCFGPVVVSISLGEDTNFVMKKIKNVGPEEKGLEHVVLVPRRSMLVLSNDARYDWTHNIPRWEFVQDVENDKIIPKNETYRRISLTYRTLVKNEKKP